LANCAVVAVGTGDHLRQWPGESDFGIYFMASHLSRYVAFPGGIRGRRSQYAKIALHDGHGDDILAEQEGNDRVVAS
jgi:hypothetical protein